MTRDEMRRMVEANDRAWHGWWPALGGLDHALARRRLAGSYPDVLTTVAHMVWSEEAWQPRLEGGAEHTDAPPSGPLADVEAVWRRLEGRRRAWVEGADPDGPVRFPTDSGAWATIRAWECVVHMISHAHFHRGQLATQFRQLGLVPPSHHLIGSFMGA